MEDSTTGDEGESGVHRVSTETEQMTRWCCLNCGSYLQKTVTYSNGWEQKECGSCGATVQ